MITKNSAMNLTKSYTNNEEKLSGFNPYVISATPDVWVRTTLLGDTALDLITVPADFYNNLVNGSKIAFYDDLLVTSVKYVHKDGSNKISLHTNITEGISGANPVAIVDAAGQKLSILTYDLASVVNRNVIVDLDSFEVFHTSLGTAFAGDGIYGIVPTTSTDKTLYSLTLSYKAGAIILPNGGATAVGIYLNSPLLANLIADKTGISNTQNPINIKLAYIDSTTGYVQLE